MRESRPAGRVQYAMRSSTKTIMSWAAAAMLAAPLAAQDGVPRILISRELQEQEVSLVRVEGDQIMFRDALGMIRRERTDRIIAITSVQEAEGQRRSASMLALVEQGLGSSVLELTDGQRLTGALVPLAPDAPAEEIVRWLHPLLGAMEFRLDDIHRIVLSPEQVPPQASAGTADVVILANGDRIEGFVGGVGAALTLEVGEQQRTIPLDRIAGIILANPPEPMRGIVVYLRDGSIIACDQLAAADDGQVVIIPRALAGQPEVQPGSESAAIRLPLVEVAAMSLDAESLSPLAALEIASQIPAEGRRWVPPLRRHGPAHALLGAPDLEFPGPMTVDWVLPTGAAWFAARAELPRTMWNWGNCELIVSLVSGSGSRESASEVFRSQLNAETPLAEIHLNLPEAARQAGGRGPFRLRVRIDPGLYGPIQDQVVLRRPLVLLATPPG
jgi:hypothetical protein